MARCPNPLLPIILAANTILAAAIADYASLFVPQLPLPPAIHQQRSYRPTLFQHQQPSVDRECENEDAHIFLRFSPLIGGPAFLPLHVEVIIATEEANSGRIRQKMDTIYIRRDNNLSLFKEPSQLHRFDFLPENPRDPSTLGQLTTLKAVPGRLRYRNHDIQQQQGPDNIHAELDGGSTGNQDGRGITIMVPIGSLLCLDDDTIAANSVVSTAINFNDKYRETLFKDLRILGGKNCLSYVLDLLSHVESTTGLQRIPRLNKLDIE